VAGPQTTREALMAELLGDVGVLLDRMEALKVDLPEVAEDAAGKVKAVGDSSAAAIRIATDQAEVRIADALSGIQTAAREARAAAGVVAGAARRFALLALLTGAAGGAVAGAVVALALSRSLFG
jgi:ATPase subunit of ABC transporter with duplicated ATPase domains